MPRSAVPFRSRLGVFVELARNAQLVARLLRDRRVHPVAKLIIPAAVAYLLFPVDIVPDMLSTVFGVGVVDDLVVVALLVRLFLALAPERVKAEHWAVLRGGNEPVDVTFRPSA
ncbi:MAG: DUF1232 domain-containing protein [Dehalococcoidia bacterium]|nr:DUF1232 domain-containing protein [Dehalococcoidia bacterium]